MGIMMGITALFMRDLSEKTFSNYSSANIIQLDIFLPALKGLTYRVVTYFCKGVILYFCKGVKHLGGRGKVQLSLSFTKSLFS